MEIGEVPDPDAQRIVFDKLSSMWESVDDEIENKELHGLTNYTFPKWAEGIFVTSGPSLHEINGREYGHIFDGLGRFTILNFTDNKAIFSSKLIKSEIYNKTMKWKDIPPGLLFKEPTPERPMSHIPFVNFEQGYGDNNWIDLELLADNKTFVATNDYKTKLEIDPYTLETKSAIQWENEMCLTGVSHSRRHRDGSVLSICYELDMMHMGFNLVLYKLLPEDTFKKVVVTRIPSKRITLQHAFAMTNDYAIIFESPWYMMPNVGDLLKMKNLMILDMIKNDINGTTKIHAVRLSDGKTTTIDAKSWEMVLHFGNSWQTDDDTIVIDAPAYERPDGNPFAIFNHDKMTLEEMTSHKNGVVFKRFTLHLQNQTVDQERLLETEFGAYDLP